MGFVGDILNTILQRSENQTTELLKILRLDDERFIEFNHGSDSVYLRHLTSAPARYQLISNIRMSFEGTSDILFLVGGSNYLELLSNTVNFKKDITGGVGGLDIGTALVNFKDLYLSGDITLGGSIIGGGYTGDFVVTGNIFMDGATQRVLYGGDDAGDDLVLAANNVDVYPFIDIEGGGSILYEAGAGNRHTFKQNNIEYLVLTEEEINYDSTGTSGSLFDITHPSLTSGKGLRVAVDIDIVTSGFILSLESGSALTTPVFQVDAEGTVFISNDDGDTAIQLALADADVLGLVGSFDMQGGAGDYFRSPVMTTAQRDTMSGAWGAADNGKQIYNSTLKSQQIWKDTAWVNM